MTETDQPQEQPSAEPSAARDGLATENLRDYERLRRSTTDRKIAGVAGGLGRHLNIDPTVLRVLFVVLAFFGGAGVLLYAAAWLIVPEEGSDRAVLSTTPSTRNALLLVAAVLAALLLLGNSWGPAGGGFPWPLAVVAMIVLVAVLATRDSSGSRAARSAAAPVPGSSAAPGSSAEPVTAPYPPGGYPPVDYPVDYAAPVPPPRPDRGPRLFGFTLAFVAVALGSLGLYEAAGGAVAAAAYPALALAVVGAMLVLGSVAGRPGGLILLGVVAVVALLVTATVDRYDVGRTGEYNVAPTTAAQVADDYSYFAGDISLDLTGLVDPENLDERSIVVEAEAGEVRVQLPDGVDVTVDARIGIGGEIDVDGVTQEGRNPRVRTVIDGGEDVPELTLDIDLTVGAITVTQLQEANAS